MIAYIEYLGLPGAVGVAIIGLFIVTQTIGEIMELTGKVAPEFLKVRKFFTRRKQEKAEVTQTLKEVKKLLEEVNVHYADDNITKRDAWMNWVNGRAEAYDNSIIEINKNLAGVTQALEDNTHLTEEMFVQESRDRIIDFARHVSKENTLVSQEEYNRIFKVYEKYEAFLEARKMKNGEVEINYRIIKDSYDNHMRNHTFIEDLRGY